MKFIICLSSLLLLVACQHQPVNECDSGSIYGYLRTEAHKDFRTKHFNDPKFSRYRSADGGQTYLESMVDYDHLTELYSCLTIADKSPEIHILEITEHGVQPYAIALAAEDSLRVINQTEQALTLFLAAVDQNNKQFKSFPVLLPGERAEFKVELEGYLQLASDETDALTGIIWSRKNHFCQKLQSNDFYNFNRLIPGTYEISFWYWRIGTITHKLTVGRGQDVRMDEILSIDRVLDGDRPDQYSDVVF